MRGSKRAAAAALAVVGLVAWSPGARADDAHPVSRAEVEDDLRGYYEGERVSAYVIGGLGAAAAASGAYLVTREGDFPRALGWSWVAMGGLELVGAVAYMFQVGAEIDRYGAALAQDPAGYRAEESDHIRGTSSRFVVYRAVELSLVVAGAGAAVYGLAANRDLWRGTGVGVLSLSLPLAVIDTFNNARASRYLDEVKRFQPSVGVQSGGAYKGWVVSVGATF
jgi:hypothetical protein